MFARFVCALLNFHAREFPAKSKTREPGKIIVECTLYMNWTTVREVTLVHNKLP